MTQTNRIKVQLSREVTKKLMQLKNIGESYDDVIRRLLKEAGYEDI